MIELIITHTTRGCSSSDQWTRGTTDREVFGDMQEAKEWLDARYGTKTRKPMYCDGKDGKTKRIGWVIHGKDYEYSNGTKYHYYTQDWVECRESKTIDPTEF
jgi:hypothetical protein